MEAVFLGFPQAVVAGAREGLAAGGLTKEGAGDGVEYPEEGDRTVEGGPLFHGLSDICSFRPHFVSLPLHNTLLLMHTHSHIILTPQAHTPCSYTLLTHPHTPTHFLSLASHTNTRNLPWKEKNSDNNNNNKQQQTTQVR